LVLALRSWPLAFALAQMSFAFIEANRRKGQSQKARATYQHQITKNGVISVNQRLNAILQAVL
jgi:hypothetical protein